MPRRLTALILILTHLAWVLPAQEVPIDLSRGFARLEHYMDRAALERSAAGWEQLAAAGLEAALLAWENANILLKGNGEWEEKRREAEMIYGLEKEKAYVAWASERLYAEKARLEGSGLAEALKLAAAEWTYIDSETKRAIDMSDTDEVSNARQAWERISGEIIDRYMASWEAKGLYAYSELRGRFAQSLLGEADREELYLQADEEQRLYIQGEYARIAAMEGNALLRKLLYDSQSLKKRMAQEAASVIARQLAEEAKGATDREIERLFGELDLMISAGEQDGITIEGVEWLESFRRAFEAGLDKWDAAEREFLAARLEWQYEAQDVYREGEAAWVEAYAKLGEAREKWEKELQEKLDQGILEWAKRQESLEVELGEAYKEFAAILEERKDNKRKLFEAQVGIYDRSRDLLEMAIEGALLWYELWGAEYKKIEENYNRLFRAQGPPSEYEYGYIESSLEGLDMSKLEALGEAGIEKLERQLELWKGLHLAVIKKTYQDEDTKLLINLLMLNAEYNNLAELISLREQLEANPSNNQRQTLTKRLVDKGIELGLISKPWSSGPNKTNDDLKAELYKVWDEVLEKLKQLEESIDDLSRQRALIQVVLNLNVGMGVENIEAALQNAKEVTGIEAASVFNKALWQVGRQLTSGETGWLVLALRYRAEVEQAALNIYKLSGINMDFMTLAGYTDELATELLKARAALKYWGDELGIAQAVAEYARRYDSELESAEETAELLKQARLNYDAAMEAYETALGVLDGKAGGIETADAAYRAAQAELDTLNRAAREARQDYAVVAVMIMGLGAAGVQAAVADAALGLDGNWVARDARYTEYMAAVQAYEAAFTLSRLADEADWLNAGRNNQQSIAALESLYAEIEKITTVDEILEQYEAYINMELSTEWQLLYSMKTAYKDSTDGAEQGALEKGIGAVWGAVLSYYAGRLALARRALEYLQGTVPAEFTGNAQALELKAWLTGQRAGIAAEYGQADERVAKLDNLLDEGDGAFLDAARLARDEDEDMAMVLRGIHLGLAGQGVAWAAYQTARKTLGLTDAEADGEIEAAYGGLVAGRFNAQARAAVNDKITEDYKNMNITELYEYIKDLHEAGADLGIAGQTALKEYIQGLLEYAAARDVLENKVAGSVDLEGAQEANEAWLNTLVQWLESLQDTGLYLETVLGSEDFARLNKADQELLQSYGARLILRELDWRDVGADFTLFTALVGRRAAERQAAAEDLSRSGLYWGEAYLALDAVTREALYDKMRRLLPYTTYTDRYDGYVQWFELMSGKNPEGDAQKALEAVLYEQVEPDENFNAAWYPYYLVSSDFLYVYFLMNPAEFDEAIEWKNYLEDDQAKFLTLYHKTESLVARYNPYLDGDINGWIEDQGLTDKEGETLLHRLQYGFIPTGIGYFQDREMSLWSGEGRALLMLQQRGLVEIFNVLYAELQAAREESFMLDWKLQYAGYVEREREADYSWAGEYKQYLVAEELTDEEREVLERIDEDVGEHMLTRLAKRLNNIALFFKDAGIEDAIGLQWAGSDDTALARYALEQARESMHSALARYYGSATATETFINRLARHLEQYQMVGSEDAELKARQTELYGKIVAAQEAYDAYREDEFTLALEGVRAAYVQYNEAADDLNEKYAELNAARLKAREKQEIYDFAQSVYLRGDGASEAEGYETPQEKLGRVRYAYERAKVSEEVLRSLLSGNHLEDSAYSAALKDYRQKAEDYYLGQAAAHEAEKAVARQRAIVARAELEEREALYNLIQQSDKAPGNIPELNAGWITAQTGLSSADFNDYFTKKTVTVEGVNGDYTMTRAEQDTIDWLLAMRVARETDFSEYFNDLMLAAVYMNMKYGSDEKPAAYEDSPKEEWYGGGLDPTKSNNYSLGLSNIETEKIADSTFDKEYRAGREKELKNAYERIMNNPVNDTGEADLARYLLYRDTTLLIIRGAADEKTALTERSLKHVISWAKERRDVNKDLEKAARITAITRAALGLPGSVAALAVAAATGNYKKGYEAVISDLQGKETGIIEIKEKKDVELAGALTVYIKKSDQLKEEQQQLNKMLYGMPNRPEADGNGEPSTISYQQLRAGLAALYGESAMHREAGQLYSEALFTDSGAGQRETLPDAINAMNNHLGGEHAIARSRLDKQTEELRDKQAAAREAYWAALSAGQEIDEDDRAELARLAALACDTTLSVADREQAAAAYKNLLEQEALPGEDFRAGLANLAAAAWGAGAWNSVSHDYAMVSHALGMYDGKWARYEQQTEPYTVWAGERLREALLAALGRQNDLELAVEAARLNLIGEDFNRQKAAWEAQARQIQALAAREWTKAEGRINEGYTQWRKGFEEEYRAKSTAWEANWLQFALEKQEWVEEQYLYAASAGNAPLLARAGADAGGAISRAMALTNIERINRAAIEVDGYVEGLLEGTNLARLMASAGELAGRAKYGAGAARKGNERVTAAESLAAARETQRRLNGELESGGARLAALQARKLMAEALEGYWKRLKDENAGMWKWEEGMVREAGYQVKSGSITRDTVVDSTLARVIRKTQYVPRYEEFTTIGPDIKVNLDANALEALDSYTVMSLVEQGYAELASWGEGIFGKVKEDGTIEKKEILKDLWEAARKEYERAKTDLKSEEEVKKLKNEAGRLKQEERDGKLGEHIGYGPVMNGYEIEHEGKGQMGDILLSFQRNEIEAIAGWAEAAKPFYDQKLWEDNAYFKPMTIRSASALGAQIVGTVAAAIASVYLGPMGGAAAMWTTTTMDRLLFATLDSALSDTNNGDIWAEFGKQTLISAGTSAASGGIGMAGQAIASSAMSVGAQAVMKGAITATNSYLTSVTNSYVGALDFRTGKMDWGQANKSWGSASAIGGMLSTFTTTTVGGLLEGGVLDKPLGKFLPGNMLQTIKETDGIRNFVAQTAGEAVKYLAYLGYNDGNFKRTFDDMGGVTLNLLNLASISRLFGWDDAIAGLPGANYEAEKINMGMLELHITSTGVSGSLGTEGINFDLLGIACELVANHEKYKLIVDEMKNKVDEKYKALDGSLDTEEASKAVENIANIIPGIKDAKKQRDVMENPDGAGLPNMPESFDRGDYDFSFMDSSFPGKSIFTFGKALPGFIGITGDIAFNVQTHGGGFGTPDMRSYFTGLSTAVIYRVDNNMTVGGGVNWMWGGSQPGVTAYAGVSLRMPANFELKAQGNVNPYKSNPVNIIIGVFYNLSF